MKNIENIEVKVGSTVLARKCGSGPALARQTLSAALTLSRIATESPTDLSNFEFKCHYGRPGMHP